MNLLATVGLTTREACGHTVRNVTGCPYAGVSDHELFDVTPYLAAYARNMLRNPICQNMPRKWKTVVLLRSDRLRRQPLPRHGLRRRRSEGR